MRFPSFCRAYLAIVKSNGGQELNLLLPSVVLTLNTIYKSILEAVQQVSACASLLMSALRDSPVQTCFLAMTVHISITCSEKEAESNGKERTAIRRLLENYALLVGWHASALSSASDMSTFRCSKRLPCGRIRSATYLLSNVCSAVLPNASRNELCAR